MDTAGTSKPDTTRQRRTRSAVSMEPQDHADVDAADTTSEDASAHSRSTPPASMLVVLLELLTRLLGARIPGMVNQAKEKLVDFFQSDDHGDAPGVQERLADAGNRAVVWARKNPGQAIAVGAAVLTAAVIVGTMLHRAQTEAGGGASTSRTAKRRGKSRKSG